MQKWHLRHFSFQYFYNCNNFLSSPSKQVAAPDSQVNHAVSPPAVEEEPKEEGEELDDLSAVMGHLGLSEYQSTFEKEKIDIESFV